MKKYLLFLMITFTAVCLPSSSFSMIVINEFLADVPTGAPGDANKDGVRHSSDDEFVEIYNNGGGIVDISGWYISDATSIRHQFASDTSISGWSRLVIFGGGNLSAFEWPAVLASTGLLSLNNTADEIFLRDALGHIVDHLAYNSEANQDQSLVRFPEGVGSFQLHTEASAKKLLFSPGADVNGRVDQVPTIPELPTYFLLTFGLALGSIFPQLRVTRVHAK